MPAWKTSTQEVEAQQSDLQFRAILWYTESLRLAWTSEILPQKWNQITE